MAKVRGPLMSMDASGQVGDDHQFRANRYGTHAYLPRDRRKQNQQAPSAAQTAVRSDYAQAHAAWLALSQGERDAWNAQANTKARQVNGWNLFFTAWKQTVAYATADGISYATADDIIYGTAQ